MDYDSHLEFQLLSHFADEAKWEREFLDSRPVCKYCGEPITEDYMYEFDNGDTVCRSCVDVYVMDTYRVFFDI